MRFCSQCLLKSGNLEKRQHNGTTWREGSPFPYQLLFRLADVECRQEDALLSTPDLFLESLVELARCLKHPDLCAIDLERGGDPVEFIDERGKHAALGEGSTLRCCL